MTIDKYDIWVRSEATGESYIIPIAPGTLREAFEYNDRAIWLYIEAYLEAMKKEEN